MIDDFNAKSFIVGLQASLPGLNRQREGNWPQVYSRFLKSVNFIGWWGARRLAANAELAKIYLEVSHML